MQFALVGLSVAEATHFRTQSSEFGGHPLYSLVCNLTWLPKSLELYIWHFLFPPIPFFSRKIVIDLLNVYQIN
jgi:hypothetical protein